MRCRGNTGAEGKHDVLRMQDPKTMISYIETGSGNAVMDALRLEKIDAAELLKLEGEGVSSLPGNCITSNCIR